MTLASIAVEEALLILKILFIVLLYLFIWRIVRSATRDLRLPQESFVLGPDSAAALRGDTRRTTSARLVVEKSPALKVPQRPMRIVMPMLIGSGPGSNSRARAPTNRPMNARMIR